MDAMTLYIIVRLANGEAHIALKTPLNGQSCERAQLDDRTQSVWHEQAKAGAKLITVFCTGAAPS